MATSEYNTLAVEAINSLLDEINLKHDRDRFVVIGGSAMAAWGIKPLEGMDLDIAVTNDLRKDLKKRPRWYEAEFTPRQLDYCPPVANGVSAIMPPFGKEYEVTAEELVAEGIACGEAGYLYSPLFRILESKIALADMPAHRPLETERQHKHWRDVMLIVRYFLNNLES
ncbi:hypothetical protein KW794_01810 [Candidatus Saccharibacteria bacterium]|nr:hypothetical protein [Candidatus Saccharibacteria bacterium]